MRLYATIMALLSLSTGSLIRGVDDPATGPVTWHGTITLHSPSVPRPYCWTRKVTLDGSSADTCVTWYPVQDRHAEAATQQWHRDLRDDEVARVDTLVSRLDPSAAGPVRPGSCWIAVCLTSSLGQAVSLSTMPSTQNNTTARQLYALLAGPEDLLLPAHSFVCPS